jgi:hypothetical protein
MNKEFVPIEESLALKELGFDEPCFAFYVPLLDGTFELEIKICQTHGKKIILAPLWQQAFRWFREKGFDFYIQYYVHTSVKYYEVHLREEGSQYVFGKSLAHEEAELACLRKLIEIVKEKVKLEN